MSHLPYRSLSLIRCEIQNLWISCTETGFLLAISTLFRYSVDLKRISLDFLLFFFIKALIIESF